MQNASIPTLNIQQIYSDYPFSLRKLSKLNKYSTKEQSRPIQVSRCEYVSGQFGPIRKCGQSTTICAVCLERLSGMELSSFIEKWFLFTQRSVLELLYPTQRDHLCNLHLDSNSIPVHFDSWSVPNKTQVEYVRIPNQKHISVSYWTRSDFQFNKGNESSLIAECKSRVSSYNARFRICLPIVTLSDCRAKLVARTKQRVSAIQPKVKLRWNRNTVFDAKRLTGHKFLHSRQHEVLSICDPPGGSDSRLFKSSISVSVRPLSLKRSPPRSSPRWRTQPKPSSEKRFKGCRRDHFCSFNNSQHQATKETGTCCGMNDLHIIWL